MEELELELDAEAMEAVKRSKRYKIATAMFANAAVIVPIPFDRYFDFSSRPLKQVKIPT